ncbi:MAG: hypothetical protein LBU72_08365 [Burkholderiaceae bacterium]|jgi:hypothetical protein|nr:hypothetical protein [Burkholderiaceae bacterium]
MTIDHETGRAGGGVGVGGKSDRLELDGNTVAPYGLLAGELRDAITNWAKQRWSYESGGKPEMAYVADPMLGKDILIGWQGVKHAISNANEPELRLIPHIPEIVRCAKYQSSSPDKEGRPHIKRVHFLNTDVALDGESLRVGVVVQERDDGHLFYDQFLIKDGAGKSAPPPGISGATSSGISDASEHPQPTGGGKGSIGPPAVQSKGGLEKSATPYLWPEMGTDLPAIGMPPVIRVELPEVVQFTVSTNWAAA